MHRAKPLFLSEKDTPCKEDISSSKQEVPDDSLPWVYNFELSVDIQNKLSLCQIYSWSFKQAEHFLLVHVYTVHSSIHIMHC